MTIGGTITTIRSTKDPPEVAPKIMGTELPIMEIGGETTDKIPTMAAVGTTIEGVDHITKVVNRLITNIPTNQN